MVVSMEIPQGADLVEKAVDTILEMGTDQLRADALSVAGFLNAYDARRIIEFSTATLTGDSKVACDLFALARIAENETAEDIAGHIASFASDFPIALQRALTGVAESIADNFGVAGAGLNIAGMRQLLDIAERWSAMVSACSKVEPKSLTTGMPNQQ